MLGALGLQVRSRPLPSAGSHRVCMETGDRAAAGEVAEPACGRAGKLLEGATPVLAKEEGEPQAKQCPHLCGECGVQLRALLCVFQEGREGTLLV